MPGFNVGDHVRWAYVVLSQYRNAVGIVKSVRPNDTHAEEFTMYDIDFPFGTRTLYATHIEAE